MNNKVKFQSALDKVAEVSHLLIGESQEEFKQQSEEFINTIDDSQYIKVPFVGVFNAGKSSLLNAYIQKPGMLPTNTLPETAVAYELYYSPSESIELFRNGNKIATAELKDIATLVAQPGDIAKVYCNSEVVKNLQDRGIILVDMPGIGSGIERHDAAIFNYIGKGTAFVLMVDAEQGSLRGSTLNFLHELAKYNMSPAVLVSKTDKKSETAVNEIIEYIQYQMGRITTTPAFVSRVCAVNNDYTGVEDYLEKLNPEALVAQKLSAKLLSIIKTVKEQLNIRIDIRSKDIANADEKLAALEQEIANVKAELPHSEYADTPEKSAQDVLDNVEMALRSKVTDIAQMIINRESEDSVKSFIAGVVRSEIIMSLKSESEQYSSALSEAVQESVSHLSAIEIDTDFMNDFEGIISTVTTYLSTFLNVGGIWGQIAKILLPFVGPIINWFFGKSDEDIVNEVSEKVENEFISKITIQLQPTVLKMTIDNQKHIQEKLQSELVSKMEKVKEGLREKMADATKSKETVQAEIAELQNAIAKLEEIKATL